MLLVGMFVYNGIIQIQGMYYPTPEELAAWAARLKAGKKGAAAPPAESIVVQTPSRPAPTAPEDDHN